MTSRAATDLPPATDLGHLPLYGLDIETDTSVDGLDPETSAVVAASVVGEDVELVLDGPEPGLLRRLDEALAELTPGVITTWNGARFDLPFLQSRAGRHGVPLGLHVHDRGASWHRHLHLDGYLLYRADVGRSLRFPCGLKAMARLVGLPAVEVDASRVHLLSASEVRRYVTSDARVTRQLVQRRWPAAATFVDLP